MRINIFNKKLNNPHLLIVFLFLLYNCFEVNRKLIKARTHNVNEVGLKVGYSTGSHFIAAFKKKYVTTPKKYLQSS
ncbi:hypothetical protein C7H52_03795 [Aurantibacter aestuarii]|uniref:HTH araC/xylS-type domain-containing protein n=1 Tax=Aurantibacter aestuarii TaxID=1266046 RepID=A0A2T1NDA4_9FLAO|nr:hypothetical protein C7H52_03795 [Aurantibacter aestuarii]